MGSGASPTQLSLGLSFERSASAGLSPFKIRVELRQGSQVLSGAVNSLQLQASRGSIGPITETSLGIYEATLNPTQSGEYQITASAFGLSQSRKALVFEETHADWNQAVAVEGLVNTEGYEDGASVSADGETLFVQYGNFRFSGLILYGLPRSSGGAGNDRLSPTPFRHPWIDEVLGPVSAPQRPDFPSGRHSNGLFLHNAASYGLGPDQTPNYAVSTAFYGFRRQADGSYANPFLVAFSDENDGLISPFGISPQILGNGQLRVAFAVDDPTDPDFVDFDSDGQPDTASGFDIYFSDIALGQPNELGRFVASGTVGAPPLRSQPFNSRLVDFGKTGPNGISGTQGNPHLFAPSGVLESIWTDDEYDSDADADDISVYVLTSGDINSGAWQKVTLPGPVNQSGASEEFQPFFDGARLIFTHGPSGSNPQIESSDYSGPRTAAGYANSANWSSPVILLRGTASNGLGQITACGEPSIAVIQGREFLFFVYAVVRGFDAGTGLPDLDFQVGQIPRR